MRRQQTVVGRPDPLQRDDRRVAARYAPEFVHLVGVLPFEYLVRQRYGRTVPILRPPFPVALVIFPDPAPQGCGRPFAGLQFIGRHRTGGGNRPRSDQSALREAVFHRHIVVKIAVSRLAIADRSAVRPLFVFDSTLLVPQPAQIMPAHRAGGGQLALQTIPRSDHLGQHLRRNPFEAEPTDRFGGADETLQRRPSFPLHLGQRVGQYEPCRPHRPQAPHVELDGRSRNFGRSGLPVVRLVELALHGAVVSRFPLAIDPVETEPIARQTVRRSSIPQVDPVERHPQHRIPLPDQFAYESVPQRQRFVPARGQPVEY